MTQPSRLRALLGKHPVVPVVTFDDPGHVAPLADALLAGGIGIVEITLRSEAGLEAIRRAKRSQFSMIVAAGTVLSPGQMDQAADAGADFVVSPGMTAALVKAAKERDLLYLPGVATASEAMRAAEAGLDVLKFFPAEAAGGIGMLNALAEPLSHLSFCPTGGLHAANLADYLSLPNVICAGGSWIADRQAIRDADWNKISARAAYAIRIAREIRSSI